MRSCRSTNILNYWTNEILQVNSHLETWIYWPDWILQVNQHPETVTTGQMRSCRSTHILKLGSTGLIGSYRSTSILKPLLLDRWDPTDQLISLNYQTDGILPINQHPETFIIDLMRFTGLMGTYSQPTQLRS